ncbi:hypothetical protein CDD82_7091 [Ophiocordyceps australis]|uniref:Uncharacterized protein n=1 Tax=Ophiocordyceps australis TaxID=1399860 RepID=A0A2C5YT12_9HYPO|nr:hypothetical protein CDD82_7091 [Ophiocordyceps australis]
MSSSSATPSGHATHGNGNGTGTDAAFTPAMRDRQARGKDPYKESSGSEEYEDEDDEGGGAMQLGNSLKSSDSFEQRERRAFALAVLDRPEMLAMYALTNNDTIPSQRQRFRAMLAGYDASSLTPAAAKKTKKRRDEQHAQGA